MGMDDLFKRLGYGEGDPVESETEISEELRDLFEEDEESFSFIFSFVSSFNRLYKMYYASLPDTAMATYGKVPSQIALKLAMGAWAAFREIGSTKNREVFITNFFRRRVGWIDNNEGVLQPEIEGVDGTLSHSESASYFVLAETSEAYRDALRSWRGKVSREDEKIDSLFLYPKSIQVAWQILAMVEDLLEDPERDNLARVWRKTDTLLDDVADSPTELASTVPQYRAVLKRTKDGGLRKMRKSRDSVKAEKLQKEARFVVWYKQRPIILDINLRNPPSPEEIAEKLSFMEKGNGFPVGLTPVPENMRIALKNYAYVRDSDTAAPEVVELFDKIFGKNPGEISGMFTVLDEADIPYDAAPMDVLNESDNLGITGGDRVPFHQICIFDTDRQTQMPFELLSQVATKFSHPFTYGLAAQKTVKSQGRMLQLFAEKRIRSRRNPEGVRMQSLNLQEESDRPFWEKLRIDALWRGELFSFPNDFFQEKIIPSDQYNFVREKTREVRKKKNTIVSFGDVAILSHMLAAGVSSNHNCVSTPDRELLVSLTVLPSDGRFSDLIEKCTKRFSSQPLNSEDIQAFLRENRTSAQAFQKKLLNEVLPLMREDLNAAAGRGSGENENAAIVPTMAVLSGAIERQMSMAAGVIEKNVRNLVQFPDGSMTSFLIENPQRTSEDDAAAASKTISKLYMKGRLVGGYNASAAALNISGFSTSLSDSYLPPDVLKLKPDDRFAGVLAATLKNNNEGKHDANFILRMSPDQLAPEVWKKFSEKYQIVNYDNRAFGYFLDAVKQLNHLTSEIGSDDLIKKKSTGPLGIARDSFLGERSPYLAVLKICYAFVPELTADKFINEWKTLAKEITKERMDRFHIILQILPELLAFDFES